MSTIISTKRLGKDLKQGRVQPIPVMLPDEVIANSILDNPRALRGSSEPAIRENVYVNRDLTKGERLAAYELRAKRRRASESGQTLIVPASTPIGAIQPVFGLSSVLPSNPGLTSSNVAPASVAPADKPIASTSGASSHLVKA